MLEKDIYLYLQYNFWKGANVQPFLLYGLKTTQFGGPSRLRIFADDVFRSFCLLSVNKPQMWI